MLEGCLWRLMVLTAVVSVGSVPDWCSSCSCQVDDPTTITLNCSRRQLTQLVDQWPIEIANSNNLTDKNLLVTFTGNNITHISKIPAIPVKKLAINMKSCHILDIDSAAFINVKNIVFLDLSDNQLTGDKVRADIFRGPFNITEYEPINLETLWLANNNIHSLDKNIFEHTPHLHTLVLNNNPFTVLDHVTVIAISSAEKLEVLDLSYTGINIIPDETFQNLKNLKQLDLSGNNFVEIPSSLHFLRNSLQYLTFNSNPIERLDSDSFLGLSNLCQLEITQCRTLKTIEADTFSSLSNLNSLNLNDNKICSIDPLAFGNLVDECPIKKLRLDSNSLSELPAKLLPWNNLLEIYLANNPWRCTCALNLIIESNKDNLQDQPTCMSPLRLSGVILTELPKENCQNEDEKDEFVSFKKGKMIITLPRISTVFIGMGFVAVVAVIGAVIGLLGSYIKNKIKLRLMFQPIRYTNITNA